MAVLNDAARQLIESGALGHLVTLNADGSPHVTVVWVGIEGDELVTGHLDAGQRKLQNIRRDPRVALSFAGTTATEIGMRHFLVIQGRARITEGGGAALLSRLAQTYVGPGTTFPPMPGPPPGLVTRITVTRVSGLGPWAS